MSLLHLFKTGTHTDRYGRKYTFDVSTVKGMAEHYNPDVYRAPLQIDHEGTLVDGFLAEAGAVGGHLLGIPSEVSPAFAKAAGGRQVSLQLFTPEAEGNPTPGVWGVAHVAFVKEGALKLLPPEFSKDNPQKPVFSFEREPSLTRFLEALGRLIAERMEDSLFKGFMDELNRLMQETLEGSLVEDELAQAIVNVLPEYQKPVSPEVRELKSRLRRWEIQDELRNRVFSRGKLPPRLLEPVVQFLQSIEGQPAVQFEAGGAEQTPYQFAMELLSNLPTVLPTGEVAAGDKAEFMMGKGSPTDPHYLSPNADEIRDYQAECAKKNRKLSFTEARAELLQKRTKGGV